MRWGDVVKAVMAETVADTVLTGIFTAAGIRKAGVHEWLVPSLEYTLISDTVTELWAPHVIQFDLFTESLEDLETAERQIGRLFNRERPQTIQGVYMWCTYIDGQDLIGPVRESHYGRALRYEFTPYRERRVEGIS